MSCDGIRELANCNIPISEGDLRHLLEQMVVPIPAQLVALLKCTDGCSFDGGMLFYGSPEMAERNETWEVADYLPGFVAFGDDGGGRAMVINTDGTDTIVYLVDCGTMTRDALRAIAESLPDWIAKGCEVPCNDTIGAVDPVDVYLDRMPAAGATALLRIKARLGLDTSIADLKRAADNAPTCILTSVPKHKYTMRCDEINREFRCLSIREK